MARPRRRNPTPVSLFPFLSVLACVIGTLTLMIATLALGQVTSDLLDESHALAEGADETTTDPRKILALHLAQLEDEIRARNIQLDEVEELRARLRARGLEPGDDPSRLKRRVDDRIESARLAASIAELEREASQLRESLDGANADLEARREPVTLGAITLQPSGAGAPLKPFFVECTERGVVIHKQGETWTIPLVLDDATDLRRFTTFLRGVRGVRNGTVVFLIRPKGVHSYQRAVAEARRNYARHAKLALPSDGPLDFALF